MIEQLTRRKPHVRRGSETKVWLAERYGTLCVFACTLDVELHPQSSDDRDQREEEGCLACPGKTNYGLVFSPRPGKSKAPRLPLRSVRTRLRIPPQSSPAFASSVQRLRSHLC